MELIKRTGDNKTIPKRLKEKESKSKTNNQRREYGVQELTIS
jgi:hypothetical protein